MHIDGDNEPGLQALVRPTVMTACPDAVAELLQRGGMFTGVGLAIPARPQTGRLCSVLILHRLWLCAVQSAHKLAHTFCGSDSNSGAHSTGTLAFSCALVPLE